MAPKRSAAPLATVYGPAERAAILEAYELRSGVEPSAILDRIESAARFYLAWRDGEKAERLSPAEQVRRWRGLGSRLATARQCAQSLLAEPYRLADFEYAAEDLAQGGARPKTLGDALAALDWLARVAAKATARAGAQKTTKTKTARRPAAGKKPDEPTRTFARVVVETYRQTAARPRGPCHPRRDMNYRAGELLDLLGACLRPLGRHHSDSGLFALWRSLGYSLPPVKGRERGNRQLDWTKRPIIRSPA